MKPEIVDRRIFIPSPGEGTVVTGGSYYTRATGFDLLSAHVYSTVSDKMDTEFYRFSTDNGDTWADLREVDSRSVTDSGVLQRHARGGYLNVRSDRFIHLRNQALLPTDSVSEFMTHNTIQYGVSEDGGREYLFDEALVQRGEEFDEDHPLPGVYRGKNCFMMGDFTCVPMTLADGVILIPCQIAPLGPGGEYENRGGGFTYTDAAVIRGTWRQDKHLDWELGGLAVGDPDRSTRGLIEPTIANLGAGRIIMVMRGSNDKRPELPGYRWYTISNDEGFTWKPAAPWRYTDGEMFHSPSSCSQLVDHSAGRLFWLGNMCKDNPIGNLPRHPFVIAEVDRESGLVIRDSVTLVDRRRPDDPDFLTLSNFYAREDRRTGHILAHVTRSGRLSESDDLNKIPPERRFQGDSMLYEINVNT